MSDAAVLLRRAARWFGLGVVAAPVLDVVDEHGLLQGLLTLDAYFVLVAPAVMWLQLGFFTAVGLGAAAVLRRHGPRGRTVLFWACSVLLVAYAIRGGLRLSVVATALILCFTYVQLRILGDASPDDP